MKTNYDTSHNEHRDLRGLRGPVHPQQAAVIRRRASGSGGHGPDRDRHLRRRLQELRRLYHRAALLDDGRRRSDL